MNVNGDEQHLAAEQRPRVLIDRQLSDADCVVQDGRGLNLFAGQGVAVREVVMAAGHGRADYLLYVDKRAVGVVEAKKGIAGLRSELNVAARRVRRLRQAVLSAAFSGRLTGHASDVEQIERELANA